MKLQMTSKSSFISFLVVAFSILFLWLIRDFFIPISIAIVLAVIFFPVKKKIMELTRKKNSLSTTLTVILILISVTLPTILAGTLVYKQSSGFYQQFIQSKTIEEIELNLVDTAVNVSKAYYPYTLNDTSLNDKVTKAAQSITKWVSDQTLIIGQNTPLFSVYIFLILYITYVLLKNASTILKDIVRFSPLGEEFTQLLLLRIATITRGGSKGNLCYWCYSRCYGWLTILDPWNKHCAYMGIYYDYTFHNPSCWGRYCMDSSRINTSGLRSYLAGYYNATCRFSFDRNN
ncbi:AI-2E family transporter [candidate division WWE3 bacterium]|nr:AI-2E family transporter [candidate division WWE3 bacterium]